MNAGPVAPRAVTLGAPGRLSVKGGSALLADRTPSCLYRREHRMSDWELQRLDEGMPPDQIAHRCRLREEVLDATAELVVHVEQASEMQLMMLEGYTLEETMRSVGVDALPVSKSWDAYWNKLREAMMFVADFDCQFRGGGK